MTVNLKTIEDDIARGKIAPVYLIQGTDQYLMYQARQLFVNIIPKDEQSMNFGTYDLKEQNLANALDDARSMPFFGERRVVIIDNAYILTGEQIKNKLDQHPEELVNYLQHPEPQTILILMAPYDKLDRRKKLTKLLQEQSVHLAFGNLTENDVRKIVARELQSKDYTISPKALQRLFQITNMKLSQIMQEIQKLMLYALPAREISEQMVQETAIKTLNDSVFDLIDLIIKFNVNQAVLLYHQLILNGEEPLRLQGAMTTHFRLLLQVKSATTSEQGTAKELGVHPYRVKLARQTVRNFPYQQLAKIYLELVKMEQQLKTTQRDPELLFELFILQVGRNVN
ncbi:DNA polymerase III subunit delta [Weissella coleopterorum]|uniref:DNA polymerase III subunit delta n=1 Tax=Weissella coleopterorum TaxID=2714949 RepID=A0A6G8AZH5_9LACO|nr:DNA polymerase III subunit delta [Weissella coleopterorum]QIL50468.1 DNA polymerase III subunit delta [Weissella coleopterorum]